MSNSTSPREMVEGHSTLPLQMARAQSCEYNSKAKAALQTLTYSGETKAKNWEKCILPCQSPHYPEERNGIWVPRPRLRKKVLNGTWHDKLSTVNAAIKALNYYFSL